MPSLEIQRFCLVSRCAVVTWAEDYVLEKLRSDKVPTLQVLTKHRKHRNADYRMLTRGQIFHIIQVADGT